MGHSELQIKKNAYFTRLVLKIDSGLENIQENPEFFIFFSIIPFDHYSDYEIARLASERVLNVNPSYKSHAIT